MKDQGTTQSGGRRIEFALIGLLMVGVGFMFADNYVFDDASAPEVLSDGVPPASTPVSSRGDQRFYRTPSPCCSVTT